VTCETTDSHHTLRGKQGKRVGRASRRVRISPSLDFLDNPHTLLFIESRPIELLIISSIWDMTRAQNWWTLAKLFHCVVYRVVNYTSHPAGDFYVSQNPVAVALTRVGGGKRVHRSWLARSGLRNNRLTTHPNDACQSG
jgi:hypothetical protein